MTPGERAQLRNLFERDTKWLRRTMAPSWIRQLFDDCDAAEARAAAAEARVTELKAALRSFVLAAEDCATWPGQPPNSVVRLDVTLGEIWEARATLTGAPDAGPQGGAG